MKKHSLLLLLFITTSCQYFRQKDIVIRNDFQLHEYRNVLGFDLQNDEVPKGSLIVKRDTAKGDHTLTLPFQITEPDHAEEIWSTSASYSARSVISYKLVPGTEMSTAVVRFGINASAIANNLSMEEDLPEGVYLKTSGLDRKFIFEYKDIDLPQLRMDTIELIGVKLPKNSVGKEVEHGMTTVPQPTYEDAQVKYFKAKKINNAKVLKLGYTLPFNANMQIALDLFIKFICSFLIPAIELVFIHGSQARSAQRKKRL